MKTRKQWRVWLLLGIVMIVFGVTLFVLWFRCFLISFDLPDDGINVALYSPTGYLASLFAAGVSMFLGIITTTLSATDGRTTGDPLLALDRSAGTVSTAAKIVSLSIGGVGLILFIAVAIDLVVEFFVAPFSAVYDWALLPLQVPAILFSVIFIIPAAACVWTSVRGSKARSDPGRVPA